VGKTDFTMNLNDIISKSVGMTNNFIGYRGSDSMPDCTLNFCWYIITEPFYISQATMDALKTATPGVEWNNRELTGVTDTNPPLYYVAQNKYAPLIAEPSNSDEL
jgi:carbonic anhydrase